MIPAMQSYSRHLLVLLAGYAMEKNTLLSLSDQVAELLRQGMREGRWRDTLPGRDQLAHELGCSDWTVESALRRLTKEGLVVSQGAGRCRRINLAPALRKKRFMRVMIFLYEESGRLTGYFVDLLLKLQAAGLQAEFASRTLTDFGMNTKRIARFVRKTKTDAWIVVAGSSEVLDWFARQPLPAFALFGRVTQVPLASSWLRKTVALRDLIDKLVALGHQRIVMLAREERRKPIPGNFEQYFLKLLEEHGIQTSSYCLPDWGDHPQQLKQVIGALFRHTPPTALILDDPALLLPTTQHLARLGYLAPEQVSLACTDSYPGFEWCLPKVTHIEWDPLPVIRRAVKWAENISHGKEDRHKTMIEARLVIGGTIGPVPH
jgi:DNA-binding LacI/PurR family transcriptional regulator